MLRWNVALAVMSLTLTPALALAAAAPEAQPARSNATPMTAEQVLEANYARFNAHDLEGLLALYADDAVAVDMQGNMLLRGKAAFRENFKKSFQLGPQAKAWHLGTLALGDVLAVHEAGEISPGNGRIQLMIVFSIKDGKIISLTAGPRLPLS